MNEGQINHLDKENFDLFKGILAAGIKEARIYYLKGELDKQANEIFAELKVLSENEIHSYLLDSFFLVYLSIYFNKYISRCYSPKLTGDIGLMWFSSL